MTRRDFLRLVARAAALGGLAGAVARRTDVQATCNSRACRGCALYASCDLPQRLDAPRRETKEDRHGRRA